VAVTVLVTVTAGGFGTVHTTVISWTAPWSTMRGEEVALVVAGVVARVFAWLIAVCATATVPPQRRAAAARGISVRLTMKISPAG